jgi:hypothetical protein
MVSFHGGWANPTTTLVLASTMSVYLSGLATLSVAMEEIRNPSLLAASKEVD